MRFFLLLYVVSTQMTIAQNSKIDTLENDILNAQKARFSAMIEADIVSLDKLLDDKLSYSHTTGWTETKSGFIETVKSKKIDYNSFIPRDVKVRIYNNMAILTGLVNANLGRTDFTIRFLEVQRKVEGHWKLAAWQSVLNKVEE